MLILFLNIQDDLNTLIKYEKKKYYNTFVSISFICILSIVELWSLILISGMFKSKSKQKALILNYLQL